MSAIRSLVARLLDVQRELPAIKKGMDNPYFKSKYADINAYIEVVMPVLIKHGVVLLQPLTTLPDGTPAVQTILTCETGERVESTCPLAKLTDPQKLGAYITYVRRYSIQSLLTLAAEDDDAEGFYDRGSSAPSYGTRPASKTAPATSAPAVDGSSRRKWDGRGGK
jgi:hypothetical protein